MPESSTRKQAAEKKKQKRKVDTAQIQAKKLATENASKAWFAPTFVTLLIIGALWIIVFYLAGMQIPFMATLGNWNMLIGMGLIISGFTMTVFWK